MDLSTLLCLSYMVCAALKKLLVYCDVFLQTTAVTVIIIMIMIIVMIMIIIIRRRIIGIITTTTINLIYIAQFDTSDINTALHIVIKHIVQ